MHGGGSFNLETCEAIIVEVDDQTQFEWVKDSRSTIVEQGATLNRFDCLAYIRPLEKHSSWTIYKSAVVCLQPMSLQLLPVLSSNPLTLPRLLRQEAWLHSFLLLL